MGTMTARALPLKAKINHLLLAHLPPQAQHRIIPSLEAPPHRPLQRLLPHQMEGQITLHRHRPLMGDLLTMAALLMMVIPLTIADLKAMTIHQAATETPLATATLQVTMVALGLAHLTTASLHLAAHNRPTETRLPQPHKTINPLQPTVSRPLTDSLHTSHRPRSPLSLRQ